MAPPHNPVQDLRLQLRRAHRVILALVGLLAVSMAGWATLQQTVTVRVRPGLEDPVAVQPGQTPQVNVWSFAAQMLQRLNRWPDNGASDYAANINRYRHFLTPSCRAWLQRDVAARRDAGELRGRRRQLQWPPGLIYEDGRVDELGPGRWAVTFYAELSEYVEGERVKHGVFRFPVRVVSYDIDPQRNPYDLALDCYRGSDGPQRMSDEQLVQLGLTTEAT